MPKKKKSKIVDKISLGAFIVSTLAITFGLGALSVIYDYIPKNIMQRINKDVEAVVEEVKEKKDPMIQVDVSHRNPEKLRALPGHTPGLRLVASFDKDYFFKVFIMNENAEIFHEWIIDYRDITKDWTYLPTQHRPYSRPASTIHGAELLDGGDMIFVFDLRGLARISKEGEIMWHIPGMIAHHSLEATDRGTYWVGTRVYHQTFTPEVKKRFMDREPPTYEYYVTEVSADGEILNEIGIRDVIFQNDMEYLLLMRDSNSIVYYLTEDYLHLNDVEEFSADMEPGIFGPGDLMISARNINTVLVFNKDTLEVKHTWVGPFVHQHDPDFIDGNRISVYDNYTIAPDDPGHASRILILDARDDSTEVYYEGTDENPFNSTLMGTHQWLDNGNLLINESRAGHAFEINQDKEIVWEYYNMLNESDVLIHPTFYLLNEEESSYFLPVEGETAN